MTNKQIINLIRKSTGDFKVAVEVLEVVLPVIEKKAKSDAYATELAFTAAKMIQELHTYLEQGKEEQKVLIGKMKEDEAILRTAQSQMENAALLAESMTLSGMLTKASRDDIKQAVIYAVMIGDKRRILEGLKEGIRQVESV